MPRKAELTWEGAPRNRWSVMLGGVRYRVTCGQLGLPREQWTKDASYQAANAWWVGKQAELQTTRLALRPHNDRLVELESRKATALSLGMTEEAEGVAVEINRVSKLYPDEDPTVDPERAERIELATRLGIHTDPLVIDSLASGEQVWADRLERASLVPEDKTIGALIGSWIISHRGWDVLLLPNGSLWARPEFGQDGLPDTLICEEKDDPGACNVARREYVAVRPSR